MACGKGEMTLSLAEFPCQKQPLEPFASECGTAENGRWGREEVQTLLPTCHIPDLGCHSPNGVCQSVGEPMTCFTYLSPKMDLKLVNASLECIFVKASKWQNEGCNTSYWPLLVTLTDTHTSAALSQIILFLLYSRRESYVCLTVVLQYRTWTCGVVYSFWHAYKKFLITLPHTRIIITAETHDFIFFICEFLFKYKLVSHPPQIHPCLSVT